MSARKEEKEPDGIIPAPQEFLREDPTLWYLSAAPNLRATETEAARVVSQGERAAMAQFVGKIFAVFSSPREHGESNPPAQER